MFNKSDFIGEQHDHGQFVIVYHGTEFHNRINEINDERVNKHSIVKDKERLRLDAIIECYNKIAQRFLTLQYAAVHLLQDPPKTIEEALAIQLKLKPSPPTQGVCICPACLSEAILACEETLTIMKDFQAATKEYTE